uniref:Uncharacterized protein n=1 Tax=Anguilla anguilla TaxID=7936 RepID=A0A0E9UQ54_ANGAN
MAAVHHRLTYHNITFTSTFDKWCVNSGISVT